MQALRNIPYLTCILESAPQKGHPIMTLQTLLSSMTAREPITRGWSSDKKYKITAADGTSYLLRISAPQTYEAKQTEFEMMRKTAATGIAMCTPIVFGVTEEGVCSVQKWIDGRDLEDVLPNLPDDEQYRLGRTAGDYLRCIHTIPAPDTQPVWEERFKGKIERKLRMYADCPLKYDGGEALVSYLAENQHLLKDRPQTFQHGDYHTGNMMLDTDGNLVIIDFNRADFGDPWEEFNRIVWSAQLSPLFASGTVDGYFSDDVPMRFWQLLALYICSNTLSSLPWAIPFGDAEIETMRRQAAKVLGWYDRMNCVVPTWYKKKPRHTKCDGGSL